ncbi:MAG: sulfotransferase [Rhodospirillaceae bacterium]|jgi:hypothetical protein|nr:sulfotransferase [Rhodospirillaceae bacterium]MBT4425515.1 sulfotransferase [Rhodospirillaceae bacterium]MBT5780472.1 sulfotransferase [Rhodospirillaceae bacterium]MBT6827943.1 sulfotransferase [Rhodospirillaceae bacterium]MBT7293255.1 sulfotransferase [Rhodospirillaceae bacterium]
MNTESNGPVNRKPDIFVAGSPRSGTTILQKTLCNSQFTNPMLGEAQHFFNLVQAYDSAVNLFDTKTKFYFTKDELFQYHKEISGDYFIRLRSKFDQNTRLVMKCPGYSKFFPRLINLVPHSQFVMIIRDTLDIVASHIEVGERQRAANETNEFPREQIRHIASRINSIYFPIIRNKELFGNRLIIIRYEKFVSGDEAIRRLAKFLNLPDLTSVYKEKYSGLRNFQSDSDKAFYSKHWEQDITNSRIGRHKEILTPQEIDTVKKTTKSLRNMFGYT